MTLTTTEVFYVDGIPLNTYAYNITSRTGRFDIPALRASNLEVPNRDGEIYQANKTMDAGTISLKMWVRGTDADGAVPGIGYARQWRLNMDTINRLFGKRNAVLTLTQTLPDGSQRRCRAEVNGGVKWEIKGANALAVGDVALKNLDGVWEDANSVTQTFSGITSGTIYDLTNFAGATSQMTDLVLALTGPITSAKVDDPATGIYVQYNGVLAAGAIWTVDNGLWTSKVGSTNVLAVTGHSGHSRLLAITPPATGGNPQIRVTGSSLSGATALTVTGRRKYLSP